MNFSDYNPGSSRLHQIGAGPKIAFLTIVGTLLFVLPRFDLSIAMLVGVIILYRSAQISFTTAWTQVRSVAWVIGILFFVQVLLDHWLTALLVVTRLVALLLLASLITLTTRSSDMIDALKHGLAWLKYLGINPDKVSLSLSLALRFIPVLATIANEVREAQKVRGLDRSVIATTVPVIVRTLKMADDISSAIEARSYDPGNVSQI